MKTAPEDWSQKSRVLAQLLSRAALGDRAAFKQLYDATSAHLFGVLLRIQRDRAVAEDLLQEVYVSAWKAAGSFDAQQAQPLTWLTHIARNKAIDSLRRAQTQPRLESVHAADDEDDRPDLDQRLADDGPGPVDLLQRAADARQLAHCMQGLSAQQRQSVALAFFDGLSHAEVAEQLREPLGTVKSWVRRALMSLKTCLERAAQRDAVAGA
ncbi:sigma-70 family RNA polymerase sigma factor [Aquabacterium humicola]|uniref:sigma-70 family RNA polymerase sigma factor n=1 Tax=Aquabacterium humicola TaxID=3237377 RepID=UPI0025435592|nr:sigma-70 family RNA polymerase sigma factor [Rubrivivax pictus]